MPRSEFFEENDVTSRYFVGVYSREAEHLTMWSDVYRIVLQCTYAFI